MRRLIRDKAVQSLAYAAEITDAVVRDVISEEVIRLPEARELSLNDRKAIIERVFADIRGFDVLQALIDDDEVSEIMVNGYDKIFVEKNGSIELSDLKFDDEDRLEYVIQKMVGIVGRTVNTASPIVDARLESGDRINAVLPPVSLNGPVLTIRKFRNDRLNMNALIGLGTLNAECAKLLEKLVKSKYNIFISGGTGSGKTTFLNALAAYIGTRERLISIEDSAELDLGRIENWIRLETRNANSEGEGKISVKELLKTSLRMRPDRIIVGEIRGKEAVDMLQAMNTGHDGSLSTGHANSPMDMLSRIETMIMEDMSIPLEAIKKQINSAIDIIVHLARLKDGSRKVMKVSALSSLKDGDYAPIDLYSREYGTAEDSARDSTLIRSDFKLPRKEKLIKGGYKID